MTCNCIGGHPCPCQRGWPFNGKAWNPEWSAAAPGYMGPDLTVLLDAARARGPMTPKEMYEQRISWIRGMSGKLSDPIPTRESVVKMLAENGIVDPEPDAAGEGK